jgi:ATP-binding cassette subfamily B protein
VVTEALRRVLGTVTGVVVANRASTVLLADRVALLEGGTITRVGTHAELLATAPEYRYLLAADDELDDGAERNCDWEQDEDRSKLDHQYREREVADEVCEDGEFVTSERERR